MSMSMSESKNLKNDDFRRLITTPRHPQNAEAKVQISSSHAFTHHKTGVTSEMEKKKQKKNNYKHPRTRNNDSTEKPTEDDIFDESQEKLTEILKNYRDRAAERRKGLTTEDIDIEMKLMGDSKTSGILETSKIESRKMEIQKSKYLGGDIEHTHLVKGLDYSLLNKVRTEMHERQLTGKEKQKNDPTLNEAIQVGNKLAKNICKTLFESKPPERNELFAKGKMAYLVDLEEEESDVPSTLLRSVYDTQVNQPSENINADSTVLINKLSQVLAYLRSDVKKKKKGIYTHELQCQNAKIFEGLDEYIPLKGDKKEEPIEKETEQVSKGSYFSTTAGKERQERVNVEKTTREVKEWHRKREQEEEKRQQQEKEENLQKKKRKLEEEDAYAELYPGGMGMVDAGGESDDDDFTKMDQGNRKGPVKRWDFESEEDYERYQSQREAHPRAAYQFGVKTSGGRKTRKNATAANEKKIDRDLVKINKILEKGVSHHIRY